MELQISRDSTIHSGISTSYIEISTDVTFAGLQCNTVLPNTPTTISVLVL